jgi:hypothetical protein
MSSLRSRCLLLLAFTLLVLTSLVHGDRVAASTAPARAVDARLAPLKLVDRVGVLVEDLTPDADALAISREAIQADAELRLRQAGLRINPEAAVPPMLYFQIAVVCGTAGSCAIDVSSAVVQEVWLGPDGTAPFMAKTWHAGEVVLAPRAHVESRIRTMVRAQTDALATDLHAARN